MPLSKSLVWFSLAALYGPHFLQKVRFFYAYQTKPAPVAACRWWHCGIATWTVGSAVAGIMTIYGTDCLYLPVYAITGAVLCGAAPVRCWYEIFR